MSAHVKLGEFLPGRQDWKSYIPQASAVFHGERHSCKSNAVCHPNLLLRSFYLLSNERCSGTAGSDKHGLRGNRGKDLDAFSTTSSVRNMQRYSFKHESSSTSRISSDLPNSVKTANEILQLWNLFRKC